MRKFVFWFHYLGLMYIQLGFHIHPPGPNIEIHVPFGFLKLGWENWSYDLQEKHIKQIKTIGYVDSRWGIRRYNTREDD